MKYKLRRVENQGDKLLIKGVYLPKGEDCWCKEKPFELEVDSDADAGDINRLIEFTIKNL